MHPKNKNGMTVRLEPIYLANVLLNVTGYGTVNAFPFVSKNCLEATLTLKVNPAGFCTEPRTILTFFPNINTMVPGEDDGPPRHRHGGRCEVVAPR